MSWIKDRFEFNHTSHQTILSMEGIRGFSVFLVFLVHYVSLIEPWLVSSSTTKVIADYIRGIGNIGVDLFFVLSGYLIYGMLIKKERAFVPYFIRRIQRIYPTFTTVFIIYLVLSVAFPSESKIPAGWQGLVFIMQNFFLLPGLFDIQAIITVAWSLSYEFFYYLLIPMLISLLRLRSWSWKKRVIFLICSTILLFAYFFIYSEHIRLLMFISGILLFECTEHIKLKNFPSIGLPALIIAISSAAFFSHTAINGWFKYVLLFVLFLVFCWESFVSTGLTNKVFIFRPMRWLGNMSYSYYLIHGLALKFLFLILTIVYPANQSIDWFFWLLLPVAFLFTLLPSAILFLYIERPLSLDYKKH